MASPGGIGGTTAYISNKLETRNGVLYLNGAPLALKFGRRGVQVGCHFVTYEALDQLHQESQQ